MGRKIIKFIFILDKKGFLMINTKLAHQPMYSNC